MLGFGEPASGPAIGHPMGRFSRQWFLALLLSCLTGWLGLRMAFAISEIFPAGVQHYKFQGPNL